MMLGNITDTTNHIAAKADHRSGDICFISLKSFIYIKYKTIGFAPHAPVHAEVGAFAKLPPQTDAVIGQRLAPSELVARGEHVAGTSPYDASQTVPYPLAQLDLCEEEVVAVEPSHIIASHAPVVAYLRPQQPRSARTVELAVKIDGQRAVAPQASVEIQRNGGAPQRRGDIAQCLRADDMLDRSVDAAIGIGRIVARIVTEHQADTGRIEVTPLGAQILGGIVAQTDGFEMTEIGVCTHIRVSEHFVNVPYRDHATLGRIVGHAVIERRVVTQSPEIGRLRRYLGIVCQAVLVACEERVARKGYTVESYLSMIAERIKELKKLETEFQNSLWA